MKQENGKMTAFENRQKGAWLTPQTKIALLFVVGMIAYVLLMRYGWFEKSKVLEEVTYGEGWFEKSKVLEEVTYGEEDYYAAQKSYELYWMFCQMFPSLVLLLGFALLYRWAVNQAARLFLVGGIVTFTLVVACQVFSTVYFLNHLGEDGSKGFPLTMNVVSMVISLAFVCLFPLILQNIRLSARSRSWIVLFALLYVLNIGESLSNVLAGGNLFSKYFEIFNGYYLISFWTVSGIYMIWLHLVPLLNACCLWHLARSEAFNGRKQGNRYAVRWSPKEPLLLAVLVGGTLIGVGLYLFFTSFLPNHPSLL